MPSEDELRATIAEFQPPNVIPESRAYEALQRVTGGDSNVSLARLRSCARWRPVDTTTLQFLSATDLGLLTHCRVLFEGAGAAGCEAV